MCVYVQYQRTIVHFKYIGLVGGEREGTEWVVREGVGAGGEMTQALYAHMNNKIKINK
jgi:NaMN:DMB phosphoribosyltransferase